MNLKNIKDALSLWRSGVDKLQRELERKLQRLAWLRESPLPKSEISEYVVNAMLRLGEQSFHHFLDQKLGPAITNPLGQVNEAWRPGIMGRVHTPNVLDPFCLFHLLREPLSKAIKTEIEAWDGLPESGPPRAERDAEILVLEKDIATLRESIESERQAAKAAGVELSGLQGPARPRDLK